MGVLFITFIFLLRNMQHHILSLSKSQDPQGSPYITLTVPTPTVPGHKSSWLSPDNGQGSKNHHTMALWTCKRSQRSLPISKPPKGRTKLKTLLLSDELCQDRKISWTFPFQVQSLFCTEIKRQHEILFANNYFRYHRVQLQTQKHPEKTELTKVRKLLLAIT